MSTHIKNYLGWTIIGTLIAAVILGIVYVHSTAQAIKNTSGHTFQVSGTGKVTAVPDVAHVAITVQTDGGKDLGALQTQNTEKNNKINAFLNEQGVASEDITTSNYSVTPRYQGYNCTGTGICRAPEVVGYTINQTVDVKVRKLDSVGTILAGAVKNGANGITGPNFTIDDLESVQNQARAKAIESAAKQARELAKAGNFRLGKIISVYDNGQGNPIPYEGVGGDQLMALGKTAVSAPVAPTIQPGSEEVMASMTVTYEIR